MVDWFVPAYKAGGPIRSCVNIARNLKNDYEIFVLTGDRDLGDTEPFANVVLDTWQKYDGNVNVMYMAKENQTRQKIWSCIEEVEAGVVYLNSMFSIVFTLYPLMYGVLKQNSLKRILAPRGMLRSSAIRYKTVKKRVYLVLLRSLRLIRDVEFHATDSEELSDIREYFGSRVKVHSISMLPANSKEKLIGISKHKDEVRVVFIARISPVKNLLYALEALREIQSLGRFEFNIYGPVEDQKYWEKCKRQINKLPSCVDVSYMGEIKHEKVTETIRKHHFMFLPTQGENFGHSIFESLSVGRPVLISNCTPWQDLESKKAGWDIPLAEKGAFTKALQTMLSMQQNEYDHLAESTWNYARYCISNSQLKTEYLKMFS